MKINNYCGGGVYNWIQSKINKYRKCNRSKNYRKNTCARREHSLYPTLFTALVRALATTPGTNKVGVINPRDAVESKHNLALF